ncbi:MAG: DNA polymerase/3'-5' exonuclease PolX [Chloroflexota bacterium]
MNNTNLSKIFAQVADLLQIRGDNIHRVLSYRRAAETLSDLPHDISHIAEKGELTSIPGIGKTLAEKIEEILATGELNFLNRLTDEIPITILDLLKVEGMGPKRVKLVYDKLEVTSIELLEQAAESGELANLPGMGKKSVEKIVAGISALRQFGNNRVRLGDALPAAEAILAQLKQHPAVAKAAIGGSVRRRKETIGDIDLLVALHDNGEAGSVMQAFTTLDVVLEVATKGPTKSRIVLDNGIGVDLRVLPSENWGTLMSYFTGSQAHNVRLRELAKDKGLSLNEYAFSKISGDEKILCASEKDVYQVLDLPYIPPELREDRGEVEAAQQGKLPELITLNGIKGDLHMHSTWSDGQHTIEEMAKAALALGHQYICITDHSYSLGIANGLTVDRLKAQREEIEQVREKVGDHLTILHGTEMEVRADGALDFEDDVLEWLDFVIAAMHTGLKQPREQVTERMLNAIENPHVDMIAHPTGRLIGRRLGADLDIEKIIEAAARTQTILEINANPARLDLKDTHVKLALEQGVKIAINTDAHHVDQLKLMDFGVATGRRGWAMAEKVVNFWPIQQFLNFI